MSAAWWLNSSWMLSGAPERAAFAWASRHVAGTQQRLLRQMLHANRDTSYGVRHDFRRISSPRDYPRRVPPVTYSDLEPLVERIAAGEPNVLTAERVRLLEPTSGTTGGEKLIPYTNGLRRQFQRGVAAWIADLFWHRPALRRGRAYWSISPALGPRRRSPGGLPIGFADDAEYLGRLEQFMVRLLLVAPSAATAADTTADRLPDMIAFRYRTLLCLLAAEDLALISIWNPTFLLALLEALPAWSERLCADQELPPRRAAFLREVLRSSASLAAKLRHIWPRLALLSCWTDAAAGPFLPALRELFPAVEIQPKGLLATEAFVSLPLVDAAGAALAIRSHFFEFEEVAGGGVKLAHELERGGRYRVLVTTAGGLYRYQLRDEIGIVGFSRQCPLLRFLGKSDQVSDLVGEKLAEPHVRAVLQRSAALAQVSPKFMLLVPVLERPPRYRLYLQGPSPTDTALSQIGREVQAGLEENPYYRHAVGMGQLAPVEVALLDPHGEAAWLVYERRALERGQKSGAVKPLALDRATDWPQRFAPLHVSSADTPSGTRPTPSEIP